MYLDFLKEPAPCFVDSFIVLFVVKGTFSPDKKKKTISFDKPVKGQYVRLCGLNSQNGQDYGAAAEIEVLAE